MHDDGPGRHAERLEEVLRRAVARERHGIEFTYVDMTDSDSLSKAMRKSTRLVWIETPTNPLVLITDIEAVTSIAREHGIALHIDGARFWRSFRYIVLPAIWPVMAIAILIRGLDLFRIFDIIWALTMGGPGTMTETISIYTYTMGFKQFETSYTAAIAFLVIAILTVVVTWAIRRMGLAK